MSLISNDEKLLHALFEGGVSGDEFDALQERLRNEPELRALYLKCATLDHLLSERYGGAQPVASPAVVDLKVRHHRRWTTVLAVAAALTAIAAVIAMMGPWRERPTMIQFGANAHANVEHVQSRGSKSELFAGSRLTLDRGSIELAFRSGVTGFIEGPAVLVGAGSKTVHLEQGRALFRVPPGAEGFICSTPTLVVEDLGTEFGVVVRSGQDDIVQVITGEVRLSPADQPSQTRIVRGGERVAYHQGGFTLSPREISFARTFSAEVVAFDDTFGDATKSGLLDGRVPSQGPSAWRVTRGAPQVEAGVGHLSTNGESSAAFADLPERLLNDRDHILLMTVEIAEDQAAGFHSEGWSGVSLYASDQERIFVGDPAGASDSWAIHPFGGELVTAAPTIAGKSTVTLRYDFRTGLAELFDGVSAQGAPVASEWIAPGLSFNAIRIANGAYGDTDYEIAPPDSVRGNLALKRLKVSVLRDQKN